METRLEFDSLVENEGLEALRQHFPHIGPFDLSKTSLIMDKADGSLISTFVVDGELHVKSKGSLYSQQAVDAQNWLNRPENDEFKQVLLDLVSKDYTVNMEWCAPHNRIVLPYQHEHLQVLNARNNLTGYLITPDEFVALAPWAVDVINIENVVDFMSNVPSMVGVEGVIARVGDIFVKVKTEEYLKLHHCKDNVNNPRRLFEAVVLETADDLRGLFTDDPYAITLIDEMQEKVSKLHNSIVSTVENFYNANKTLDRKSFAIKGQAELSRMHFGLAMTLYLNKPVDYKDFMISHWKDFGLKDEKVVVE